MKSIKMLLVVCFLLGIASIGHAQGGIFWETRTGQAVLGTRLDAAAAAAAEKRIAREKAGQNLVEKILNNGAQAQLAFSVTIYAPGGGAGGMCGYGGYPCTTTTYNYPKQGTLAGYVFAASSTKEYIMIEKGSWWNDMEDVYPNLWFRILGESVEESKIIAQVPGHRYIYTRDSNSIWDNQEIVYQGKKYIVVTINL